VSLAVGIALLGSAASAISDARTGTIPNRLTYALWIAGAACAAKAPPASAMDIAAGVALTAAAALPLYTRGLMGGGDVKLLIGLAALDGSGLFCRAALYSFTIGGIAAGCMLASHGGLRAPLSDAQKLHPLPFAVFACAGQAAAIATSSW
jgi:prepilin peptidase CpaA